MRQDTRATIVDRHQWGDYTRLILESEGISAEARPGQFVMVRIGEGPLPLLRRPFSIHDAGEGRLAIFFQIAGAGTALLGAKRTGERLDILGPLGRGFSLDLAPLGSRAALIGGGRGIAPFLFLGRLLRVSGVETRVYYGGRSLRDLPLIPDFEAGGLPPHCSTDDGSHGFHGLITEVFQADIPEFRPEILFACGPEAMLKTLGDIAGERGLPAELSLEAIMGCGFGACWGCVHRIRRNGEAAWRKTCTDGPVFKAEDIIWGEGGNA